MYSVTNLKTVASSTYGREATDLHLIFLKGFGYTDLVKQIYHSTDMGTS